jgi:hypothetical protein
MWVSGEGVVSKAGFAQPRNIFDGLFVLATGK